jgi:ribonuclease BN (tRNA processing enzyme)
MKITTIGTASGFATAKRSHAAVLVESGDTAILLDAGEGTVRAMLTASFDPNRISSIIITHTHHDHCGGVPGLIQYMHLTGRTSPLDVYLPRESVDSFQVYLNMVYLFRETLPFTLDLHGWEKGMIFSTDDLRVEVHLTCHLEAVKAFAEALGLGTRSAALVVQGSGKRVVYSSDLGDITDLRELPEQADLLIMECTHISLDTIMEAVSGWEVRRVLLTHIPPELEEKRLVLREKAWKYGVHNVEFAQDGLSVFI